MKRSFDWRRDWSTTKRVGPNVLPVRPARRVVLLSSELVVVDTICFASNDLEGYRHSLRVAPTQLVVPMALHELRLSRIDDVLVFLDVGTQIADHFSGFGMPLTGQSFNTMTLKRFWHTVKVLESTPRCNDCAKAFAICLFFTM